MADLAQLAAWRDALMAAALAELNRQIAGATDQISVVRIQSSKGL